MNHKVNKPYPGARVINLGFGGTGSSDILLNAVDYALAHDVIVVAAGGNKGNNIIYYPAGYSVVIAVSAVDNGFSQASFSSFGDHISLSAPGVDIQSTFPGGTYSRASGTSIASAHVSGAVVLLAGQPQFSDVNFLTSALFNKALDLGTLGRDPYFGYGVIQAFDALNYAGLIVTPPVLGDVPAIPGGDVGEGMLDRCSFGIEGDKPARELALRLIGEQPWHDLQDMDAAQRARYHAACALAANHLAVLHEAARSSLTAQGLPAEGVAQALATLMQSSLQNLLALGVPKGVTGPIARGDLEGAARHVAALGGAAGELYAQLSARLAAMMTPAR